MDYTIEQLISKLEDMTTGMVARLNFVSFEELAVFVDDRQELIDQLEVEFKTSPPNESVKKRLRAIVQSDVLIKNKIEALKNEAADWLRQKEKIKVQRNAYESVYNYSDSILMDQKK